MKQIYISIVVVLSLVYLAFIFKWGIGTGSIVMGVMFAGLALISGVVSLFKR